MILASNLGFRTIPPTRTTLKQQKDPPHQINPVSPTTTKACECFDLHKELISYGKAWSWQKQIVKQKQALIQEHEDCSDSVIILQHNPVYTMGTGSSEKILNFDMKKAPFYVYQTERGGEVTYQCTMVLDRTLEELVIRVLSSTFSIKASRIEGLTGVWVGNQKLAAIGVRVSKWITYHGLTLNVITDLTPFSWIVPCGLQNRQVGSIKGLLQELQSSTRCSEAVKPIFDDDELIDISYKSLIKEFSEVFNLEIHLKAIDFGVPS